MKKILLLVICIIVATTMFACTPIGGESFPDNESTAESFGDEGSNAEESIEETVSSDVSTTSDGWVEIYDFLPYVAEFGKDLRKFYENGSMCAYRNEELGTFEIWMISETFEEVTVLRMKKTDAWEDITSDLDVKWTSDEDVTDRSLSGKRREGSLKVSERMKSNPYHPLPDETKLFCEIWYDATDKMTCAVLLFDENLDFPDPYPTFFVGTKSSVDFATFDEAKAFLDDHNYMGNENNKIFMNGDGAGFTYVGSQSDDTITVYKGNKNDYVENIYQNDGTIQNIHRITETTDIGYNEIVITGDHYSKNVYDNESNLLECINRNEKEGYESYIKIENGKTVYTKFEDDQCIEEETFYEGGKTKKRYSKFHKETFINEYKFIMDNGEMRYYILSSEGDFGYRKYTYVDESSTYLVRLEAYMNEYDELVIWELNGTECNDTMNNVISLERTINGKTKFYTKDEIPWGTGMVYPPHFQHELRN